jgi:hypothetical protein
MQLVNQTPVPARLLVTPMDGQPHRFGMIVAKATYRFDAAGPLDLVADDPVPLFEKDTPTELGLLPRDDLPRRGPQFEVILLGKAHAPGGKPAEKMTVGLTVGAERRELLVHGDRVWETKVLGRQIGPPVPFTTMPLTWARAYGGAAEVQIDRDAPVEVTDPMNRYGRGFNVQPLAENLRAMFTPPRGYPQYDPVRPLPNVEAVASPIGRWEDAPRPACWATVPMDIGLQAERSVGGPPEGSDDFTQVRMKPGMFLRAHPDWVLAGPPPAGAAITLEGLTPAGRRTVPLPRLRVVADWVIGDRRGATALEPQMLVLLPEQERLYLLYRHLFDLFPQADRERSARLRLEEGWP